MIVPVPSLTLIVLQSGGLRVTSCGLILVLLEDGSDLPWLDLGLCPFLRLIFFHCGPLCPTIELHCLCLWLVSAAIVRGPHPVSSADSKMLLWGGGRERSGVTLKSCAPCQDLPVPLETRTCQMWGTLAHLLPCTKCHVDLHCQELLQAHPHCSLLPGPYRRNNVP